MLLPHMQRRGVTKGFNNDNNNNGNDNDHNNNNNVGIDEELEEIYIHSNNNNNNNGIENNNTIDNNTTTTMNQNNNNNLINRNVTNRNTNASGSSSSGTTRQPQPQQQNNNNNRSNNSNAVRTNIVFRIGVLLLKIVFYPFYLPLRYLAPLLFPAGEFDGLSSSSSSSLSTERKASLQFVNYLKQLQKQQQQQSGPSNNETTEPSPPQLDSYWNTISIETITNSNGNNNRNNNNGVNKLVLVYLHSPDHVHSKSFCNEFLLSKEMSAFLVSSRDHLACIGVSIHTAHGAYLSQILSVNSYPYVCLLQPKKLVDSSASNNNTSSSSSSSSTNNYQLVFKAQGNVLLCSENNNIPATRTNSTRNRPPFLVRQLIIQYLQSSVTRFEVMLAEHDLRRRQREEEIELRKQQDYEYQESLRIDQEREARVQEEKRKLQEEQERERLKLQQQERIYDNARELLSSKGYYNSGDGKLVLPPNPSNNSNTRIRFVLPGTGTKLDYRFHDANDTIGALRAFLLIYFKEKLPPSNNNATEIKNIGLSTNFPKQTYEDDEETNSKTLKEAGLSPQAVLMVQDLDA